MMQHLTLRLLALGLSGSTLLAAASEDTTMTFALTGDSIINRRVSTYQPEGIDAMWSIIRNADAAFTNFETLIHDWDLPGEARSGGTYMGSPTFVGPELEWAGFDLLGLANNHTFDYGLEGMRATVRYLSKTNMVFAGTGENLAKARAPGYLDTTKGRVALISTASSFTPASVAGPQRSDIIGRPGLNPLRFTTTYTVEPDTMAALSKLKSGADAKTPSNLDFLEMKWKTGNEVKMNTEVSAYDLEEIAHTVRNARAQADWVMVSIHSHESLTPDDRTQPAEFLVVFAKAMIDAGADMVVGHGPHLLRGIEIYKGKPIFYCLANFIFENDLVEFQPWENYDKTELPATSLPSEYYSKRSKNDTIGFTANRTYWDSVVAETVFDLDRNLKEIRLHPVTLGFGNSRTKRGQPAPANAEDAAYIINQMTELSKPFGVTVINRDGVGIITPES